ncbi:MAG: UTRA domain-containing protein [Turicibacter sp.]|nr:UTRA domain-containing protein [Turicibacter sp.]
MLVPAGESVASVFGIDAADEVFCLTRTRMVNDDIILYSVSFVPRTLSLPTDVSLYDSLYHQFSKQNITIGHAEEFIEATLADEIISEKLEIPLGAAVLKRTRTSKDTSGQYIEYTETYYRSDKYKYVVELTQ